MQIYIKDFFFLNAWVTVRFDHQLLWTNASSPAKLDACIETGFGWEFMQETTEKCKGIGYYEWDRSGNKLLIWSFIYFQK